VQAKRQECYDDTSGDGREQGYTGGIKQQGNTHAGQDAGDRSDHARAGKEHLAHA